MNELVLDVANILGGLLLLTGSVQVIPKIGDTLENWANRILPYKFTIGCIAFIFGVLFLMRHIQHPLMFEISGILVGITLIGERWKDVPLIGQPFVKLSTLLTSLGIIMGPIAIFIGFWGLVTPN